MRVLTVVWLPVLLAGFVMAHAQPRAQVSPPAAIAMQSPCQFTTFEEQPSFTRRFYSKAEYDQAKTKKWWPKFRELEPDVELVMPAPRARTSCIGKRAGLHERSFTGSLCAENGRGIDPCAAPSRPHGCQ